MADEQTPRKPGFFSRLSAWKESAPATPPAEPAPVPETSPPDATSSAPRMKGFLRRIFGGGADEPSSNQDQQEAPHAATVEDEEKGWFSRLVERIGRSSSSLVGRLLGAIGLGARLDEETLEKIEEILIQSDVSMATTQKLIERLRERARRDKVEGRDAILAALKAEVRQIVVSSAPPVDPSKVAPPYVVLVVGVNGVGKTTTIGKMAKRCADRGMKVMLVAGDTFRAAAVEQLEIWAGRCGAAFVKGPPNGDAGALAFDALNQAKAQGIDIVFIDTAGRLHTKSNLMAELEKVDRVIKKRIPEAPHETLLVLDGTTGQNAVQQVTQFSKIVRLNGLIMTKLDGTAKGGILITIRDQFDIPVTLIGVGEGAEDLRDFDPERYVDALFAHPAS